MDKYMNLQNNAHEMEIKLACARWLENKYAEMSEGVLINEFSANRSRVRADLVCVTKNEIVAIEIKSKSDNTIRLSRQIRHLRKLYNKVEIIVAANHCEKARTMCLQENVGLHVFEDGEIITILKGRPRNISRNILENSVFPQSVKLRADFCATESYYRKYLINRYGKSREFSTNGVDKKEYNSNYIRNLNLHYTEKINSQQKKIAYQGDMEALLRGLQSTQSSSSSSAVTPTP